MELLQPVLRLYTQMYSKLGERLGENISKKYTLNWVKGCRAQSRLSCAPFLITCSTDEELQQDEKKVGEGTEFLGRNENLLTFNKDLLWW